MFSACFDVNLDPFRGRAFGPGIGGARLDPGFEVGDDRVGELSLRRHFQPVVLQSRQERAVRRIALDNRRTTVAANP